MRVCHGGRQINRRNRRHTLNGWLRRSAPSSPARTAFNTESDPDGSVIATESTRLDCVVTPPAYCVGKQHDRTEREMSAKTSTTGWFLPDQAIAAASDDTLNHEAYSNVLISAIRSASPPATIGLLGGFGVGKSSIANLVKAELLSDPKFDVIRVSADKHSGVERSRNLVHSVAGELASIDRCSEIRIKNMLAPLRHTTQRSALDPTDTAAVRLVSGEYKIRDLVLSAGLYFAASVVLVLLAIVVSGRWGLSLLSLGLIIGIAGLGRLFTSDSSPLRAMFTPGTRSTTQPRAEAADDIEIVFAGLVEHHHHKTKRQLVVVVDDIDRLANEDLLDALRSIKSLQSVPRTMEPIFVLACSEEILINAIGHSGGVASDGRPPADRESSRDDAAHSFLDKLLTVRIPIPPVIAANMREFAVTVLPSDHPIHNTDLDVERVTRALIHDRVNDPRSVIRLWNRFFSAYLLGAEREKSKWLFPGDVTNHTVMLARLSVLFDEFGDFYTAVADNQNLLQAADRMALGHTNFTDAERAALNESKLLAPTTESDGDEGDGTPPQGPNWATFKNGEALRRYLMSTARNITYPDDLLPLIRFEQAGEERVLGSSQHRQVVAALKAGDAEALTSLVHDQGAVLRTASANAITTKLRTASPYDAPNYIAAATGALSSFDQPTAASVADETSDLLRNAGHHELDGAIITTLLDHSSAGHRPSLCGELLNVDDLEDDQANNRMANSLVYMIDHPETSEHLEHGIPVMVGRPRRQGRLGAR